MWFPHALPDQQLLTSSVASQECCIMYKYVGFGQMLTNGKMENDLQRIWESRLIPLPESPFKFARRGGVLVVRHRLSIKRLWVRITFTAGRSGVFHIELELKIHVYVLYWLEVIRNCTGSWVEEDSWCARQTDNSHNIHTGIAYAQPV